MRLLLGAAVLWCVVGIIPTRSDTPLVTCSPAAFVQVSSREFINPTHLGALRLPAIIASDPSCYPSCQVRWGAQILVDGEYFDYSVEAEPFLRKWVGAPPMP